jgi:glycosyltransferase involved in cell wall biosynthesis
MNITKYPRKFSIILPVRDGGVYVKQCVNSILQQSENDFDLIIFENFSTDGTAEWLKSLKDERIRVLPAVAPLSLEDNWCRSLSIDKNEFLTFIGHDDVLAPDYLKVLTALIKEHPNASLYQTHFDYIDESGNILRSCQPMSEVLKVHEFVAHQLARTLDSMGTGYVMRSADFHDLGGFSRYSGLLFGDYELWVKLIGRGYLATAQSVCFSYREHASSSAIATASEYQKNLFKYLRFLDNESKTNELLSKIIYRYCSDYLIYMCESLVYRSLLVGKQEGEKSTHTIVREFQEFRNELKLSDGNLAITSVTISIAILIDKWQIGRMIFKLIVSIRLNLKALMQQYCGRKA